MRKHGIANFIFEIIYQSLDHDYTKNVMEGHFIKTLGTHISLGTGYNVTHGGEGTSIQRFGPDNPFYGRKHNKAAREAISLKARGRRPTEKQRINMSLAQIGRKHTEITRAKMSKAAERGQQYLLTSPTGNEYITTNLRAFGKEHGLNGSELGRVCNGKYKHHHGWIAKRL